MNTTQPDLLRTTDQGEIRLTEIEPDRLNAVSGGALYMKWDGCSGLPNWWDVWLGRA